MEGTSPGSFEPSKMTSFKGEDDIGMVLGQPLFHSRRRLLLMGLEPLQRALAGGADQDPPLPKSSMMVLSADSLEPVWTEPTDHAVMELKWFHNDESLLVAAGSNLYYWNTTAEDVADWSLSSVTIADYGSLIRDVAGHQGSGRVLIGGHDRGLLVSELAADGGSLRPIAIIPTADTISSVRWQSSTGIAGSFCCSVTLEHGTFEYLDMRCQDPHAFRFSTIEKLYTHAYGGWSGDQVLLAGAKGKITVVDLRYQRREVQVVLTDPGGLLDIGGLAKVPTVPDQPVWCVAGSPGFSIWDMSFSHTCIWHEHLMHRDLNPAVPSLSYAAFADYGDLAITTSTGQVAIFDQQYFHHERDVDLSLPTTTATSTGGGGGGAATGWASSTTLTVAGGGGGRLTRSGRSSATSSS